MQKITQTHKHSENNNFAWLLWGPFVGKDMDFAPKKILRICMKDHCAFMYVRDIRSMN